MRQTETPEGRSVRLLRVGEQVRHALSDMLMRGDVHDETLASHMVSVTEVRMSPDLRHATVFVIPLLGSNSQAVLKALRTNTAFLQSEVARRVNTKYAAKLKFLLDESFDEGSHIDKLLRAPKVAPRSRRRRGSVNLGDAMAAGDVRLEPLAEAHRAALKAACAEDREIWPIYSTSYGPDHFDANFDLMLARPDWRTFALFRGGALAGMSSFMGIDTDRMVLEIGSTYYVPAMRGTGFNRVVKDLMLAPRLRLRLPPGRVPGRRPQRAQPGGARQDRRGARGRAARRPDHLDRPCPRHRSVLDPGGRVGRRGVKQGLSLFGDCPLFGARPGLAARRGPRRR